MLKRIISIILLLMLCGCERSIASSIYVASMHFAYENEKYVGNFYVINSLALGVKENKSESKGSLATVEGESIAEIFSKIDLTTALDVNFKHIASIILDVSFMKKEFIFELAENIKQNVNISYNSYIFVSEDDAKEIYNIKNPGDENDLHSIINSPIDRKKLYMISEPINFLGFMRNILNGSCVKIPVFSLDDSWDIEGINYYVNKVCYFKDDKIDIYNKKEYPGLQFLNGHKLLLVGDELCSFYVKKVKIKRSFKDDYNIKISFYYDVLYSEVKAVPRRVWPN